VQKHTERIQVLVTVEQRERIEREARRRGSSVAVVIREAIDAQIGAPAPGERPAGAELRPVAERQAAASR